MATEFPDLGGHCNASTCNQHDFLPMKCDACAKIFCTTHIMYSSHRCTDGLLRDVQVPVCPLCNRPIPVPKGTPVDVVVGRHIDSDCKSDVAKKRIYKNACSMKGCKKRELIEVRCLECKMNYCLRHRHSTDHDCQGRSAAISNAANRRAATASNCRTDARGSSNMSEDEALARALQMSLNDGGNSNRLSQAEQDEQLAQQMQQEEYDGRAPTTERNNNRSCEIS